MEIKRIAIDAVNEIIEMTVVHMDYKGQVQKRLNEKMPLATVKGFRKGQVPRALVEKQYGRDIKIEEVNKVVELALDRYIDSQRLALLGTPIFKENPSFDWQDEEMVFEYEIGLAPSFEVDFETMPAVTKYEIELEDPIIDSEILKFRQQFGIATPFDSIENDCSVTATFENNENQISISNKFYLDEFDFPVTKALFIGKKVGEKVIVNSTQIFKDPHDLIHFLKVSHDIVHNLAVDLEVTIDSIHKVEVAPLGQEFFDQFFGAGVVTTEAEMKSVISKDYEAQFKDIQKDKFQKDVIDAIVENVKMELPKAFLIKWMHQNAKAKVSTADIETEYESAEKALRFQLIQGKTNHSFDQKVTFEELKSYTTAMIYSNMQQYGHQATASEIDGIVARVLASKDEVTRLTQEVIKNKNLIAMIDKVPFEVEKTSYKNFRDKSYNH